MKLLILTSPPASGKTYWLRSFSEEIKEKILFVSPLRALADECRLSWSDSITVVTPEEWLVKPCFSSVVVFDEFHLNFYWGSTFRERMWEAFYGITQEVELCVALTATLGEEMVDEIKKFRCHFDEIIWCNQGNRKLKFTPEKYIVAPSKKFLEQLVDCGPTKGVTLIFCAYRQEVRAMELKLLSQGRVVWACVGGEAQKMRTLVSSGVVPEFIVSTSVLSHGVNLPDITRVIFLYPLGNIDFWIQMVARGGRRGGGYEVWALEKPTGLPWGRWANFWGLLCQKMRMWIHEVPIQVDQWFLKESSSQKFPTRREISS